MNLQPHINKIPIENLTPAQRATLRICLEAFCRGLENGQLIWYPEELVMLELLGCSCGAGSPERRQAP